MPRTALGLLAATAAIALTATACTSDGGSADAGPDSALPTASVSSGATTSGSAAASSSPTTPGSFTGPPATPGGTPSRGGFSSVSGGTSKPIPLAPAPAGTYTYDVSGTTTGGTVPRTSTLVVSSPVGTRQTTTVSASDGSSDTQTVDYRSDGVYFVELKTVAKLPVGGFLREDLKPVSGPVRVIRTDAQPGQYMTFKVASADGKVTATVTFSIYGSDTATIAGKSLPAFRVRYSSTDLSGNGLHGAGFDFDIWLAPTNGLAYKIERHVSANALGQTFSTNTVSTLKSTSPQ